MSRALPIVVALALAVYALVDCIQSDPAEVRGPRRVVWGALILLLPIAGPVAWLLAGRPRRRPRPGPRPVAPPPVAPEDDPEFLHQMHEIDAEHERLLEQWERDLRKREDELRRRDEGGPGDPPPTPA